MNDNNNNERTEILKKILKELMGDNKTILGVEVDAEGAGDVTIEGMPITLTAAYSMLTHGLFKSLQEHKFSKAEASQMMLEAYASGISFEKDDEEGEE